MINVEERKNQLKEKKEKGKTLGSLYNINIALEDNISTKGIKTRVGSKMLKDYIPPFNATLVEKVLMEDGVLVCKVPTREFGVGEKIDSQMGELVRTGQADISIGIDGEGEIRNLAAKSNLYGLKPTYGSVSRYGLIGSCPSLEQAGIISKDIDLLEFAYKAICGKDKKDSTSLVIEEKKELDIKNLNIGLIKEYMDTLENEIREGLEKEIEKFKDLGAKVEYISIPCLKYGLSAYKILQSAEFSSDMGKFDGLLYGFNVENYKDNEDFFKQNRTQGFSQEVKKKIIFGNFVLSKDNYKNYYEKSQRIRTLIRQEVDKKLEDYDIILSPLGEENIEYTVLANLAGLPAISLPALDAKGWSLQLMGEKFSEGSLFKIAREYKEKILKSKESEGK